MLMYPMVSGYTLYTTVGMSIGWTSPALAHLKEMNYDNHQINLMASVPLLAPGTLLTMFGLDLFGRKGTIFIIWTLLVLCYFILCISADINAMLFARSIAHCGMTAALSVAGFYISEISDVGE